jgi:hypothetical protein
MTIDNNCWDVKAKPIAKLRHNAYDSHLQLKEYIKETGQDQNSIFKDPLLVDSTFALSRESPCINTGLILEHVKDDFTHSLRNNGPYDIGAFEYK